MKHYIKNETLFLKYIILTIKNYKLFVLLLLTFIKSILVILI